MARVLFIEDDVSWQGVLEELIETAWHESKRATTIDTAIALMVGKQKYDVIVFDLKLGAISLDNDLFTRLDALIQGLGARKLQIPPVIILSGVEMSKQQIIQAFTEYRGYVYNIFSKSELASNRKSFLLTIKQSASHSTGTSAPKSFFKILGYATLMSLIVFAVFGMLIWSVRQIPDPQTQQTIVQIGGALIVIIAIFISIFSQNEKLQDFAETIQKIWRG